MIIKTEEEIRNIRQAVTITDRAFVYIIQYLKIGISERDIAQKISDFVIDEGAHGLAFDTVVVSGLRSRLPHGKPTDKKLEYGDFVTIDLGCVYNGCCSDMTRTVIIGGAYPRQIKIYNVVKNAMDAAIQAIKPGISCSELDAVGRDIIDSAGYGKYFTHCLGHGVGASVHEEPNISQKCDQLLCKNMVIAIEPGVYIDDFGGIRLEDVCLVTDSYENLCSFSRDLMIL